MKLLSSQLEKTNMTTLQDHIKQQQEVNRGRWDNLQRNRIDRPSRKETHSLSDKTTEDTIKKTLEWERKRIKDWLIKRCEANIKAFGTDKWNGDMEDLLEAITQLEDSKK